MRIMGKARRTWANYLFTPSPREKRSALLARLIALLGRPEQVLHEACHDRNGHDEVQHDKVVYRDSGDFDHLDQVVFDRLLPIVDGYDGRLQ
jgi:hypothetical protein